MEATKGLPVKTLYLSGTDGAGIDLPKVYRQALEAETDLTVVSRSEPLNEEQAGNLIRGHDVYLICRHSQYLPASVATEAGNLKLVCAVVGSLQAYVPPEVIDSSIVVTNWGDAPAGPIAEGAMALLLASLKDLHHHVMDKRRGSWKIEPTTHGGVLNGRHVGLYGLGFIGRRFVEMIRPFEALLHIYDPYTPELPEGTVRETSLHDLFSRCSIIAVHAGLTPQTRGSVTAELLSLLPDHGVLINTARGAIIDQEALFVELESGRLRAGLDVLEPDQLPPNHPARGWENLILTAHQIHLPWPSDGAPPEDLTRAQEYSIENLRRLRAGEPPLHEIDHTRYRLMT